MKTKRIKAPSVSINNPPLPKTFLGRHVVGQQFATRNALYPEAWGNRYTSKLLCDCTWGAAYTVRILEIEERPLKTKKGTK